MKSTIHRILIAICFFQLTANTQAFFYDENGHKYTTYLVAKMAGISDTNAYILTYYSQYPDLDRRYDAVSVSLKFTGVPWKWGWRSDITEELHSLHGGNNASVQFRRQLLAKLIQQKLKDPTVENLKEAGLLIHAFGDSFAHTKGEFNGGKEKAYGQLVGHLFDGHKPDDFWRAENFPKYQAYVSTLYHTLQPEHNPTGEDELKTYLNGLAAYVGDEKGMKTTMNEFVAGKDFRIAVFNSYRNPTNDLSSAQIQKVLNEIKGAGKSGNQNVASKVSRGADLILVKAASNR